MNIKQIRYFAAVVKYGSLSAASKEQYVTVQAISKAIGDLERELGRSLFVRESRGVHPTAFGAAFHHKTEPVLRDFEELEVFAANYQENQVDKTLRLALCAPAFYRNEQARASIATFAKRGLGLDVTVDLALGEDAFLKMKSKEYDGLITVGLFAHPDVDCVSVGPVLPGVIMAKNHPLAKLDYVRLVDLQKYPIATSDKIDLFNDTVVAVYKKQGVEVDFVHFADGTHVDAFLNEGQGLIFAVGIPALGELHPNTEMRLIAAEDAIPIPLCLVSLKNRKSPAFVAFERWLTGEVGFLGGSSGVGMVLENN